MKATRKIKTLAVALLASALLTVFGSVATLAMEVESGSIADSTVEIETHPHADIPDESCDTADIEEGDKSEVIPGEAESVYISIEEGVGEATNTEGANAQDVTSENALAEVYETVKSYTSEIFSTLAFIGTLIVAFIYKKGLLPVITRTTTAISTLLSRLRAENAAGQKSADDKLTLTAERLAALEERITDIRASLDAVGESLDRRANDDRSGGQLRTVISAQVDMLYAIFMSSALPQYQKDEVGERITAMKKELENYEKVNEKH